MLLIKLAGTANNLKSLKDPALPSYELVVLGTTKANRLSGGKVWGSLCCGYRRDKFTSRKMDQTIRGSKSSGNHLATVTHQKHAGTRGDLSCKEHARLQRLPALLLLLCYVILENRENETPSEVRIYDSG
jgi:hypothetical protein